jgi:DNA-binding response OmpR family regulator
MKVLVIEDDSTIVGFLQKTLQSENHVTSIARDSATGLRLAEKYQFDAIVLERMSPGLDGLELLRQIRRSDDSTPVLILTARDGAPEVASALGNGSDDFLIKPFSAFELFARLQRLVQRGQSPTANKVHQARELTLDTGAHQVFRGTERIHLTRTEYRLFELLISRPGVAVSRRSIIEVVWGVGADIGENTLDTFIRLLRKKVETAGKPQLIQTVRGYGYRLEVKQDG